MKKSIFRAALLSLALLLSQLVALPAADAAPGEFLYLWGAHQHFEDPAGVAVDGSGNVYVTDVDKIQVFNSSGIRIRKWGSYGSGEGQMKSPGRLAVDATGRVYVADTGNGRVDVFDTSGNFLGQWDNPDWGTNPPISVASDGKGKVYVLEASMYDSAGNLLEGTIKQFDSEGNFLRQIGTPGPGVDQYTAASAIALDQSDNVYVMSFGDGMFSPIAVQMFNAAGAFVKTAVYVGYKFGVRDIAVDSTGKIYLAGFRAPYAGTVEVYDSAGNLLRQVFFQPAAEFWFPIAVSVDSKGNIYTVDDDAEGVRVFDTSGTPLSQWWTYGTALGQLSTPTGIAIDSSGMVYETDGDNPAVELYNDRIQVFTGTGTPVAKWTGNFVQTSGVAVDNAGTIEVLDTSNRSGIPPSVLAHVFDSSGNDIRQWGDPNVNGQYRNPFGIVQDKSGNFLVTDQQFSTVLVYDSAGTLLKSFGTPGSGNGQFSSPRGITVDAAGNIFVVDSGNGRVQVFDSAYNFVRKWGSPGFSNGYFRQPSGIAVDGNGNVFVADTGNNRIQVLTSAGLFLQKWGGEGDDNGQFRQPRGIALDRSGAKVYVADTGNNRIQAFQGYGSIDVTPPTVTAFTIPATSSSLTVPITTLTASDNTGVTGYLVNEAATKPAASDPAWSPVPPTSYTFASAGTKTLYAWAKDAAGNVSNSRSATVTITGTLPGSWLSQDIGIVGLAGSASYANGIFTIKGAGADIFATSDAFRFVYQAMSGDGTIIAHVASQQNTNYYAKTGVMIRQSLASNSIHAMMSLSPGNGAQFVRRTSTGGWTTATTKSGIAAPYWVKLVRSGSTFTGSVSSDGISWVQIGNATVSMTGTVYVGLAVSSHNTSALCTVTMDSVTAPGVAVMLPKQVNEKK